MIITKHNYNNNNNEENQSALSRRTDQLENPSVQNKSKQNKKKLVRISLQFVVSNRQTHRFNLLFEDRGKRRERNDSEDTEKQADAKKRNDPRQRSASGGLTTSTHCRISVSVNTAHFLSFLFSLLSFTARRPTSRTLAQLT